MKMIPASHALTQARADEVAAQNEAWRRLTPPPATPPPAAPASAKRAPRPPRRAVKPPAPAPVPPPAPAPGGLVLSPDEVAALDRLLSVPEVQALMRTDRF